MADVFWQAASDGRYWIDVLIGGKQLQVMIDLGLIAPLDAVGFELEPASYDQLNQAGLLSQLQYRFRRDANAQVKGSESGLTTAQSLDPSSKQGVGPSVQLQVCRGVEGVPNRVGVVFFHRLAGCEVHWDSTS